MISVPSLAAVIGLLWGQTQLQHSKTQEYLEMGLKECHARQAALILELRTLSDEIKEQKLARP